ncbi:hypothetical protein HYT33_01750, partial [Candidatus Roizmanbacteria bacterium]|nr:hypothetical protein [Candidatus Roizmanbacteria bacterium]
WLEFFSKTGVKEGRSATYTPSAKINGEAEVLLTGTGWSFIDTGWSLCEKSLRWYAKIFRYWESPG